MAMEAHEACHACWHYGLTLYRPDADERRWAAKCGRCGYRIAETADSRQGAEAVWDMVMRKKRHDGEARELPPERWDNDEEGTGCDAEKLRRRVAEIEAMLRAIVVLAERGIVGDSSDGSQS